MLPPASSTTTLAPRARLVARATSGRPAPDSTAAETPAKASRNALVAGTSACSGCVANPDSLGAAGGAGCPLRGRPSCLMVPISDDESTDPRAHAGEQSEDTQSH